MKETVGFHVDLPDSIEMLFDTKPGEVVFLRGQEMLAAVPQANELYANLIKSAEEATGLELAIDDTDSSPWVMAVHGPGEGIGQHREGFDYSYTLLVALNSIPDEAEGNLVVEGVDQQFPHKKGRAVLFPGQVLHGNKEIKLPVMRVTLAGIVTEK